jgi:hypothetical protein
MPGFDASATAPGRHDNGAQTLGLPRHWPPRSILVAAIVACCLAVPANAFAGTPGTSASSNAADKTRLVLILALIMFAGVSWLLKDMLVGTDKRVSTSKTTAALWTYLVASSLLGFVVAKLVGYPEALENMMHSGLAGQYGLLIGGPLGAAIAAKGIVGNQVSKNSAAKTPGAGTSPAQLVQNDAGDTDLGDFQYILFNLVAMVYFLGTIIESPTAGFPHIPDILLGLTSVSAAGYVAKKALPTTAPTAALATKKAAANTLVRITGTGLLIAEEPQTTALSVLFGSAKAEIQAQSRAEGKDTIEVQVPEGLPEGKPVDVVVVTPAPARVYAGSFTIK